MKEGGAKVISKLRAIAFTDSVHSILPTDPKPVKDFVTNNAINWECSDKPLDTLLCEKSKLECKCVSAGTPGFPFVFFPPLQIFLFFIRIKLICFSL